MRWTRVALGLLLGGLLLAWSPSASAQRRNVVVIEPVPVGPVFWGPYPYYPYGYYYRNAGTVKLETHDKNAAVYINGGYAGTTDKNKKFTLRPGNYDFELRDPEGKTFFQERVAVTAGNTTKVRVG